MCIQRDATLWFIAATLKHWLCEMCSEIYPTTRYTKLFFWDNHSLNPGLSVATTVFSIQPYQYAYGLRQSFLMTIFEALRSFETESRSSHSHPRNAHQVCELTASYFAGQPMKCVPIHSSIIFVLPHLRHCPKSKVLRAKKWNVVCKMNVVWQKSLHSVHTNLDSVHTPRGSSRKLEWWNLDRFWIWHYLVCHVYKAYFVWIDRLIRQSTLTSDTCKSRSPENPFKWLVRGKIGCFQKNFEFVTFFGQFQL